MNTSNKAFDFEEFCKIASRDEEDFADMGTTISQGQYDGSRYTFKDNSSNVLGVAHLDTVQADYYAKLINVKKERVLVCPRLDDRLGVYIITRLLPKLGITCDWLLTTGEEVGCSSAELFKTDKTYNWSFSFDRMGTDVVLYQHDHKALRRILRKSGFTVGWGTFSDLSSLEIGCSGINFGCGYQDCHSHEAYAILSDTFHMVDRFQSFWRKYASHSLPYDPKASYQATRAWWRRDSSITGYTYKKDYNNKWSPDERAYEAYSHYGRNGYSDVKVDPYTKEYLDWYVGDNGEHLTEDEKLEILADQAQYTDNGR